MVTRRQLLVNNGFDDNTAAVGSVQTVASLAGWTTATAGGSLRVGREVPNAEASSGGSFLELNSAQNARSVKQSVTTTAGLRYMVELDASSITAPTKPNRDIEVIWAGKQVAVLTSKSTDWQTIRFEIIGIGSPADLVFRIMDGKNSALRLDDVVVYEKPNVGDDERINGTATVDNLTGNVFDDTIFGLGGNDTLTGGRGRDAIFGGDGADSIYGEHGYDTLHGGNGNDVVYGGDGIDWLFGNAGADTLYGGDQADSMNGGMGADLLYGGAGDDTIKGNLVVKGVDEDYEGRDTIYGGAGNDVVHGGAGVDEIHGDAGNDSLAGDGNSDTLYGGAGNDTLTGGQDPSGFFSNELYGGDGDDVFYGGLEAEVFYGGAGMDIVSYEKATTGITLDLTDASNGRQNGSGDRAGDAIEQFHGSKFNDAMYGTVSNDWFRGLAGNDTLQGANGNDTLYGGDGNDVIEGGLGNNILRGEAGADVFRFSVSNLASADRIEDFERGVDKIAISGGSFSAIQQSQVNNSTILSFASGNGGTTTVTLDKVTANLAASDFVF